MRRRHGPRYPSALQNVPSLLENIPFSAGAARAPHHAITSDDFTCLELSKVGRLIRDKYTGGHAENHSVDSQVQFQASHLQSCSLGSPEEGTAAVTGIFNKTEAETEVNNEAAAASVRRGEAWRPPTSHSAGS